MKNAIKTRIIDVSYVYADITDSSGSSLGKFGVSSLSTTFAVGSLPVCSLNINDGTDFSSEKQTESPILKIIAKQNTDDLHVKVVMNMAISNEGIKSSQRPDPRQEVIFNGIITSMSINYNYMTVGRSSYGVSITAIHRFADLYAFGAGGFIYAPASYVQDNASIDDVISKLSSESRANQSSSSQYNVNIVETVLDQCTPTLNSSSTKAYKSIPDTIKVMVNLMKDRKILVPEGKDPKISSYLTGSVTPKIQSKNITDFYKTILDVLFSSVAKGNLVDAIQSSCSEQMGIYLVPRSTDSICILPVSSVSTTPKDVPIISSDMYHAIRYTPNMQVGTNIQGVLVTYAGSARIDDKTGFDHLIRGRFPENTDKGAVRWMCIPAPSWFDDAEYVYGNKSGANGTSLNPDYIKELCTMYAADQYFTLRYKNNTVELVSDLRSVQAYKALGAVFDIEYPSGVGTTDDKLRATLVTYNLNYQSTSDNSGVEIKLLFNNARSSAVAAVESTDKSLYSIDDKDLVNKFPDVSAEFKQKEDK